MSQYMVFVYGDTPAFAAVGMVEVPPCFRPTEKFEGLAASLGLSVEVWDGEELPAPPPPPLLEQGADIMLTIRSMAASQN